MERDNRMFYKAELLVNTDKRIFSWGCFFLNISASLLFWDVFCVHVLVLLYTFFVLGF